MPLTAGKRDEDNERYKNTLQRLISLAFIPENFKKIDSELEVFGLNLEVLHQIQAQALIDLLESQKFDFDNMEQFADFLLPGFPLLAVAVYTVIQSESKTFSFAISQKINLAKR